MASKDKGNGSESDSPPGSFLFMDPIFYPPVGVPVDPEIIYLCDPDYDIHRGSSRRPSLLKCKAGRFAGRAEEDVYEFMSEVEYYIHDTYMSPKDALKQLPLLLDGVAAEWWRCFRPHMPTWDEASKELIHHFGGSKSSLTFIEKLRARRQQPNESAADYIVDMQDLMIKLDPPPAEKHQVCFIIAGLLPSLGQKMMSKHNLSLKEIANEIIFAEQKLKRLGLDDP